MGPLPTWYRSWARLGHWQLGPGLGEVWPKFHSGCLASACLLAPPVGRPLGMRRCHAQTPPDRPVADMPPLAPSGALPRARDAHQPTVAHRKEELLHAGTRWWWSRSAQCCRARGERGQLLCAGKYARRTHECGRAGKTESVARHRRSKLALPAMRVGWDAGGAGLAQHLPAASRLDLACRRASSGLILKRRLASFALSRCARL